MQYVLVLLDFLISQKILYAATKVRPVLAGLIIHLIDEKYDLLGREAVTNHVYSYLTNLDAEWSVRVGLIAPWGAGQKPLSGNGSLHEQ